MKQDKNTFLRQAVVRICGTLDIKEGMRRSLDYIKDFIPVDTIHLSIYRADLDMVEVVQTASDQFAPGPHSFLPFPEIDWRMEGREIPGLKSIWMINEPDKDPRIKKFCKQTGMSPDISIMFLRLELEGKLIGELGVKIDGNNCYTREHAELLLLLREPFAIALANALKHEEIIKLKDMLSDDYRYLQQELRGLAAAEIIGADFGLRAVMDKVRQVASRNSPVLLLGETGVGKDVIANAIHYSSLRQQGPFIRVNCGAIPNSLVDSELFGHEKGAFTGASRQKRGRFERADNGSLFLDEVGELPPQAQVRLLHVLQNHEIERVGGTKVIPVDTRFIFATHRNLEVMVDEGLFRQDLYYRINVFPIHIPPLRQRQEDIPALVHYFIEKKCMQLKIENRPRLGAGALDRLCDYGWPGNIRELENTVERALLLHEKGCLDFKPFLGILSQKNILTTGRQKSPEGLSSLEESIRKHIRKALKVSGGKIAGSGGAAELLHIHPNTLRKKMDKLGISYKKRSVFPS